MGAKGEEKRDGIIMEKRLVICRKYYGLYNLKRDYNGWEKRREYARESKLIYSCLHQNALRGLIKTKKWVRETYKKCLEITA